MNGIRSNFSPSRYSGVAAARQKNDEYGSTANANFSEAAETSAPEKKNTSYTTNSSAEVQNAWDKAEKETGYNPSGIGTDGKMSSITATVAMRMEQLYKTGSGDIFGSSSDSALNMAQKILERINNPLTPPKNAEERKQLEAEKSFYEKFIENLAEKSKAEPTPTDIYAQMTGRNL